MLNNLGEVNSRITMPRLHTMEEYQIIVDDKKWLSMLYLLSLVGETAIMTDAIHIGEFSAKMPDEAGKLELTSAYKVEIQKDPNG